LVQAALSLTENVIWVCNWAGGPEARFTYEIRFGQRKALVAEPKVLLQERVPRSIAGGSMAFNTSLRNPILINCRYSSAKIPRHREWENTWFNEGLVARDIRDR
jgi:hypothetical protein